MIFQLAYSGSNVYFSSPEILTVNNNLKPMLKSEPRNPPPIPCLLNFFLQHKGETELYHKIIEVDNISNGWK